MAMQRLTDSFPEIMADFPNIGLVYLFGSQVTGNTGPMSDIDLAIQLDSTQDSLQTQTEFQYRIVKLMETGRVDVVVLNRAPVELAYNITVRGKLLFARDESVRVDYEFEVISRYGDYLPILRDQKKQILQGEENAGRVQRYREALKRTQRTLNSLNSAPGKKA